jgi:hypothetical protein
MMFLDCLGLLPLLLLIPPPQCRRGSALFEGESGARVAATEVRFRGESAAA